MDWLNAALSAATIPVAAVCFWGRKPEARICAGYMLVNAALDWLVAYGAPSIYLKADMLMSGIFAVLTIYLVVRRSDGPVWPLALTALILAQMVALLDYTSAGTASAWVAYVEVNRLTYTGELAALFMLPWAHDGVQFLRRRNGRDFVRHRNLGWVERCAAKGAKTTGRKAASAQRRIWP